MLFWVVAHYLTGESATFAAPRVFDRAVGDTDSTATSFLIINIDSVMELPMSSAAELHSDGDSDASSSSPIRYATEPKASAPRSPSSPPPTGEGFTTRKGKDYRPVSTWYLKGWLAMSPAELICRLAVCPDSIHEVKPMDLDRGPIPTQSIVLENLFILAVATVPLVVQGWAYAIYPRELTVVEDFRRILTPRVLQQSTVGPLILPTSSTSSAFRRSRPPT